MIKRLSTYLQYIIPQHLLTKLMASLANIQHPRLKNYFIQRFIQRYQVDMSLAAIEDITAYPTLNSFFTRALKNELRPIAQDVDEIACPVDGTIAEIGHIKQNQLLQAKNFYFDLETLLGGETELAETFYDGSFATLYLGPKDYHRVHMPLSGQLERMIYVPGKLFSVNRLTADLIPNIYSRNERVICIFNTAAGPMAVILVGAMIVGSMETVWSTEPIAGKKVNINTYSQTITLEKGAEMGRFKFGSTVILLFPQHKISWSIAALPQTPVKFGQILGNILR